MQRIMIAVCGCALSAQMASGAMVEMQRVNLGKGSNVKLNLIGSVNDVFAGELVYAFRNGTAGAEYLNGITLNTYCTEITQASNDTWQTFTIADLSDAPAPGPEMGAEKADAIAQMYALLLSETAAGRFDNDTAAGFQTAVWEVVYDFDAGAGRASMSLSSGALVISETSGAALGGGVATKFNMFADAIGSGGSRAALEALVSTAHQDQIIPTPGALALAGAGVVIGLRRRTR